MPPSITPGSMDEFDGSSSPNDSSDKVRPANGANDVLHAALQNRYGEKLDLIERIRGEISKEELSTPGIIVIGSQSVGKSSILSRLTGIEFPTGENTVTCSPTVVSVRNDARISGFKAWISNDPSFESMEECSSVDELKQNIKDFSAALTEKASRQIVKSPVYVRRFVKRGQAMTLIDLPGITELTNTTQPAGSDFNIRNETEGLVRQYMNDNNMIALVAVEAAGDPKNSPALRLAKEIDPNGLRTIGVVTKCDELSEEKENFLTWFNNESSGASSNINLGYYGVINKVPSGSPLDVDEYEAQKFGSHKLLARIPEHHRTMDSLKSKLVQLQWSAVQKFFAAAETELHDRMNELQAKLNSIQAPPSTTGERQQMLTHVLDRISKNMEPYLVGKVLKDRSLNISRVAHGYVADFIKDVREGVDDILGEEYLKKVQTYQTERYGTLFPSEMPQSIVPEMGQELVLNGLLQEGTTALIDNVTKLMGYVYGKVIHDSIDEELFPYLAGTLKSATKDVLVKARGRTSEIANEIISSEKVRATVNNPTYDTMLRELQALANKLSSNEGTSEGDHKDDIEKVETNIRELAPCISLMISGLPQAKETTETFAQFVVRYIGSGSRVLMERQFRIRCYVHIMLLNMFDTLPMIVKNIIINTAHEKMHTTLYDIIAGKGGRIDAAFVFNEAQEAILNAKRARLERITTFHAELSALK